MDFLPSQERLAQLREESLLNEPTFRDELQRIGAMIEDAARCNHQNCTYTFTQGLALRTIESIVNFLKNTPPYNNISWRTVMRCNEARYVVFISWAIPQVVVPIPPPVVAMPVAQVRERL